MSSETLWRFLNKSDSRLPFFVACGLAALPIAVAVWLIYSSAVNVPDNDYAELMERIGHMIEPNYNWLRLARDSSMSSHCLFFPMLFHLANIHLFQWNIPFELYTGLVLCFLRVLLLDKMLNCAGQAGGEGGRQRSVLNAAVMLVFFALSFGPANVSVYLYNLTAIAYGITFLFLILGLHALYSYGKSVKGLALMVLCGLVTSFCNGGSAMFSWMVFALYVLVAPGKNRIGGITTCAAGFILSLGSIWYLVHSGGIESATLKPHIPDPRMYLNCFALPFLNNTILPVAYTNTGIAIGAAAWLLALVMVALVLKKRLFTRAVAVSLALIAFATLNLFAASACRTITAPWYGSFADLFWFGIIGLSLSLSAPAQDSGAAQTGEGAEAERIGLPGARLNLGLTCLPLALISVLFFTSNLTCHDKDGFRDTHSLASESVMRHYTTCPTYGEASLFNFTIGSFSRVAALCAVPARHGLCCYSGAQTIFLQGDYLFPQVRASLPSAHSQMRWVRGDNPGRARNWMEPEHLNLALGGGARLVWPIEVPENCGNARFDTSFKIGLRGRKQAPAPVPLNGEVSITDMQTGAVAQQKIISANGSWSPLSLDLRPHKGHKIQIGLAGPAEPAAVQPKIGDTAASNSAISAPPCIVLEAPRVSLGACPRPAAKVLGTPASTSASTSVSTSALKPANTELSPDFRPPGTDDFLLSQEAKLWNLEGLAPAGNHPDSQTGDIIRYKVTKALPSLTYKPGMGLERYTVDRFYIQLSVPKTVKPRAVCCQLVVNGSLRQFFIPLLDDAGLHQYTYDLKLTNLAADDQIVAFKVLPIYIAEPGPDCVIGIGKIGFLKP